MQWQYGAFIRTFPALFCFFFLCFPHSIANILWPHPAHNKQVPLKHAVVHLSALLYTAGLQVRSLHQYINELCGDSWESWYCLRWVTLEDFEQGERVGWLARPSGPCDHPVTCLAFCSCSPADLQRPEAERERGGRERKETERGWEAKKTSDHIHVNRCIMFKMISKSSHSHDHLE